MSYELEKEDHLVGLGDVYCVEAPFDEAIKLFKKEKLDVISARDLAYARIKTGKNSSFSLLESFIKEGAIYFPNKSNLVMLVRNSAVLKNPSNATRAHRKEKEFFITIEQTNYYLGKTRERSSSAVLINGNELIPTNRFGEDETTAWLFQDQAQDYGFFLRDARINLMALYSSTFDYVKYQVKPIAHQLWFGNLLCNSTISDGHLSFQKNRIRGVKNKKKVSEGETK